MKTLSEFMQDNDYTDESFGERIGKSRMQIYRYRHGLQVPTKKTMQRILEESGGVIDPSSFYQAQQQAP